MEPSPSTRYNLRSRGRIIGNRLLRLRRGVPVYNSSANHHHQSCVTICYLPPIFSLKILNSYRTQRQSRLCYMEMFQPYPLVAMQHYNKMLKEKIRDLGRSEGLPEGDVDGGELELEFDFDWCKKVVGVLKGEVLENEVNSNGECEVYDFEEVHERESAVDCGDRGNCGS
ncbi:hypothetical protein Ahy_B07g088120 [Arachis hypogaea]|uniref:Uncharacterized protein n=1 Tax=Arachis hypogaea TaxID=3818 RepID=A0A444YDT3_ARAHY|nr:hypothetical protein Ahy_B07g088120 [Arachis hypogaea]